MTSTVQELDVDAVFTLLHQCVDTDEEFGPDEADTSFVALGYDSLAVLDLVGRVQRTLGVALPDDAREHFTSARATVDYLAALPRP